MPTTYKPYEYLDSVFKEKVITEKLKSREILVDFQWNVLEVKTQITFSFTLDSKGDPRIDYYFRVYIDLDFEDFDEGELRDELLIITGTALQAHTYAQFQEKENADTQED